MAGTMHAKINRRKLNKLNIAKICEEILSPAIPMALRLSGILMGGVVIVYERKVRLLYDDVSRLLVEINEAWKVKNAPDPTRLPKGKSRAKKAAITGDEEQMTREEIEQSLRSNAAPTMGFQQTSFFSMRLDSLDDPNIGNIGREEEDPMIHLHQAAPENITLMDSFQTYMEPHNRFESPAAIGSALSTTASLSDNSRKPIMAQRSYPSPDLNQSPATPFDMGSGFVNATAALNPGLLFDSSYDDYMSFLCGINGTGSVVLDYTGQNCLIYNSTGYGSDLNLPSITIARLNQSRLVQRTVQNIAGNETYNVGWSSPYGVSVKVYPTRFSLANGEKQVLL